MTALAGSTIGSADGTADECSFNLPFGLVVDESSHSCFVADHWNHSIRKISSSVLL